MQVLLLLAQGGLRCGEGPMNKIPEPAGVIGGHRLNHPEQIDSSQYSFKKNLNDAK